MNRATKFAAVAAVRHAAHHLGDYWAQTNQQAITKGKPGRSGVLACLGHVATYTAVNAAAVAVANKAFGLGLSWRAQLAGEVVSAVTHYLADRRDHGILPTVARVTGSAQFYANTAEHGPQLLDQAWHQTFNAVAAAVTASWGDQ